MSSTENETENSPEENKKISESYASRKLSDALDNIDNQTNQEDTIQIQKIKLPMIFDIVLSLGLLLVMGGFSLGLLHMYIVHSASQNIHLQNYQAAISILKGAPLPQIFSRVGSDTEELLSQALYLDAINKLDNNQESNFALKELSEIKPGSKFFALAQEAINENTEPAPIMLQGSTETTQTAAPEEQKSLLERTLEEEKN